MAQFTPLSTVVVGETDVSEESLNQRPEIREIAPDHLIEWCPDCQKAMGEDQDA